MGHNQENKDYPPVSDKTWLGNPQTKWCFIAGSTNCKWLTSCCMTYCTRNEYRYKSSKHRRFYFWAYHITQFFGTVDLPTKMTCCCYPDLSPFYDTSSMWFMSAANKKLIMRVKMLSCHTTVKYPIQFMLHVIDLSENLDSNHPQFNGFPGYHHFTLFK